MKKALIFLCVISMMAFAVPAFADPPAYVAVDWNNDSIYLLNNSLAPIGSFLAGAGDPNGVTSDGTYIYSGHYAGYVSGAPAEVIAYNFSGVEQFRWTPPDTSPGIYNLQGMTMVGSDLAIYSRSGFGTIDFYEPLTGNYIRSISNSAFTGTIEGLAYDGSLIWAIGGSLLGINPTTGEIVTSLPNAASTITPFGGTGIAIGGANELVLAADTGQWYRVSKTDGSVIASGSNGIDMYDLAALSPSSVPEPITMLLLGLGFVGLAGFSKSLSIWNEPRIRRGQK